MARDTVYLYVQDTLADWEPGLNIPRAARALAARALAARAEAR